jgi:hypothetical protein
MSPPVAKVTTGRRFAKASCVALKAKSIFHLRDNLAVPSAGALRATVVGGYFVITGSIQWREVSSCTNVSHFSLPE